MKLVNRKTRKAIEKSVRKAVKKSGPALMAALASGLASSLATLATTESSGKRGKSNLADMAERVGASLTQDKGRKSQVRGAEKKGVSRRPKRSRNLTSL